MVADPTNLIPLKIDHNEQFTDLPRAPIVEAVIQINSRVRAPWEEKAIGAALSKALPEYPITVALNAMRMTVEMKDPGAAAAAGQALQGLAAGSPVDAVPVAHNLHTGFEGIRMESADRKWVAHFGREFFALSRLAPYEKWSSLSAEALRLWDIYAQLGDVEEVGKVASRFINRIDVPMRDLNIGDYFEGFGSSPAGFSVGGFLHHTVLIAPGHPYFVNLIQTHQPVTDASAPTLSLLLDLEAFRLEQVSRAKATIPQTLADLRWVKNKVFFGSVTDRLLDLFR